MSDRRAVQNIAGGPKPPATRTSGAPTILDILRVAGSPVSPPWPAVSAEAAAAGMTLQEFAAWAGVNRSRLAQHCVVIPPGPLPLLHPGQIPVRLIGKDDLDLRAPGLWIRRSQARKGTNAHLH